MGLGGRGGEGESEWGERERERGEKGKESRGGGVRGGEKLIGG